jgi:hypothetical protein
MADENRTPDDQLIPGAHHDLIRRDQERLMGQRRNLRTNHQLAVQQHSNHQHPNNVDDGRRIHHGPDGKRRYHHSHSNHHLPHSLQMKLQDAHTAIADIHYREMNTSVPGGPSGGFPGLPNPARIKDDIRRVRQAAIDDWHEENPDHRVEDKSG